MNFNKKVAAIHDLSGIGRCSLTVILPILSVMGVQCCPVPTAVLSCHTGFDKFYFRDMTECMTPYLDDWNNKKIPFEAIYSGFLGSAPQIRITEEFIKSRKNSSICVVDTVMGDNGQIYPTYTKEMCDEMKSLVSIADVITPNVTEACCLTQTEYMGENISAYNARELMKKLEAMGCKSAVITGIVSHDKLINLVMEKSCIDEIASDKAKSHSGTGDLFASVVTGFLVKGKSLSMATDIASRFIYDVLNYTFSKDVPKMDGVLFEPLLCRLGDDYYEKQNT